MNLPSSIRDKVVAGDRYWHAVVLALISIVIINLVFATWRIVETSAWLQEHRAYIQARDSRWEPFLRQIEDHLTKQDADYKSIHDHMEKHEKQMDSLKLK